MSERRQKSIWLNEAPARCMANEGHKHYAITSAAFICLEGNVLTCFAFLDFSRLRIFMLKLLPWCQFFPALILVPDKSQHAKEDFFHKISLVGIHLRIFLPSFESTRCLVEKKVKLILHSELKRRSGLWKVLLDYEWMRNFLSKAVFIVKVEEMEIKIWYLAIWRSSS